MDAFIDPEGYRAYIDAAEAELRQGGCTSSTILRCSGSIFWCRYGVIAKGVPPRTSNSSGASHDCSCASAWQAADSRIEAGHALNARIFRELKLERTRSALRPLWWLLGTELAIALVASVLLGGFLADHWHLARFAVPAIVLDVVAVLTIGSAAANFGC